MPDFLLEIGTEEVPAAAVVPALEQLRVLAGELLDRERLAHGEVRTVGTPRRLVVYARDVAERQEDATVQQRGPARSAAFDAAGGATRAAEGFARKYGLTPGELVVRQLDGGEYVFAEQKVEGRPAAEVLGAALPGLLGALAFPKFMRWGEGRYRFSRPIRWLTALLGAEVVPFEIEGIRAGRLSQGHRFIPVAGASGAHAVEIRRAEEYFERMGDARVVVEPAERTRRIREQGDALAAAAGVRVVWDPELLQEVTYVVEHPTPFLGAFSEEYLSLPRPVLVSAMRKHQRYFYLETADGSLAPRFLAVRNGDEHGLDTVREGNERVLFFRFNDAVHHHNEDLKTTLREKRERLRRVVFMEKLGTLEDKSARLERVVADLAGVLGNDALRERACLAASLAKADLASHMVAELPELQGIIGREYALREGVDPEVADAIGEHYQPRAAGDTLPRTLPGRLLALADRLDLVVAALSLGHVPSGSSDPFGLRRAAGGAVALLRELPGTLSLSGLIDGSLAAFTSEEYYRAAGPQPAEEVRAGLLRLLRPRLEAVLGEEGIRPDLAEAVLAAGFESVPGTLTRAAFLAERSGQGDWQTVVQTATRIRNILRPGDAAGQAAPGRERLEHPTEIRLADELDARQVALEGAGAEGDWAALWDLWAGVCPTVDALFIDVMVNAEDAGLRAARHGLLRRLDDSFLRLADFSKVADL